MSISSPFLSPNPLVSIPTPTLQIRSASTSIPPPPFPTSPQNSQNLASSSELYLYTFLATLVLLLGVAFGIVLRSLLLRRRHRRMVAEAIRNGTWPPNAPYAAAGVRGPRKSLGAKPKMFVANIGLGDEPAKSGKQKEREKQWPHEVESWTELMPVSAAYVAPPGTSAADTTTPSASEGTLPPRHPIQRYLPISFSRSHRPSSSPPTTNPSTADIASDGPPPPPSKVQVVVLIAMPSRIPSFQAEGEEDELPHVEFGTATVGLLEAERTDSGEKGRMSGESDATAEETTPADGAQA